MKLTTKWLVAFLCIVMASCSEHQASNDSLGDLKSYDKASLSALVEAGEKGKAVKIIRAREQLQLATSDDFLVLADIYITAPNGPAAEVAVEKARQAGAMRSFTATKMAAAYMLQGRLKDAKSELQAVEMTGPDALDALLMQGQIAVAYNQPAEARRYYNFASNVAPNNYRVNTALALLEYNEKNLDEAKAQAEKALSKNPNTPIPAFILGSVERLKGNIKEAVVYFESALEIDSTYTFAQIELIGAYLDLGRKEEAEKLLDKVALVAPDYALVKFYVAYFQADKGDLPAAEATLLRAGGLIRTNPQAAKLYGMIEYSLQKYDNAADYLQIYLKNSPNDRVVRLMVAESLRQIGFPEPAMEVLKPIMTETAMDGSAFAQAGVVANAMGRPEQAQKYFAQAEELLPDELKESDPEKYRRISVNLKFSEALADYAAGNIEAAFAKMDALPQGVIPLDVQYQAVGRMQIEQGDYDGALQTAAQLHEAESDSVLATNIEGVVAMKTGDAAKAVAYFTKVLGLKPAYMSALKNRAEAYIELRQFDAAIIDLEGLTASYPGNGQLFSMLGQAYLEVGRNNDARRTLDHAKTLLPNSVVIVANYGEALAREGSYRKAIAEAEAALAIAHGNEALSKNKQLMQSLNANLAEYKEALANQMGL